MSTLLIVEDDVSFSDTLYDAFESDHRCHVARTAEEALSYLETEEYDAVLTDVSMPGMSGLELLGHIRQRQPNTPVIIMSGVDYGRSAGDLERLGAFECLVKPFRLRAAEETVARALAYRKQLSGQQQTGTEESQSSIEKTPAAANAVDTSEHVAMPTDPSIEFDLFENVRQRLTDVLVSGGRERIEAEKIALYVVQGVRHVPGLLKMLEQNPTLQQAEVLDALGHVLDETLALEKARRLLLRIEDAAA